MLSLSVHPIQGSLQLLRQSYTSFSQTSLIGNKEREKLNGKFGNFIYFPHRLSSLLYLISTVNVATETAINLWALKAHNSIAREFSEKNNFLKSYHVIENKIPWFYLCQMKSGSLSANGEILPASFLKFDLVHTSLEYWEESNILLLWLGREEKEKIFARCSINCLEDWEMYFSSATL